MSTIKITIPKYSNTQLKSNVPYYNRQTLDCSDNCTVEEVFKDVCCREPVRSGKTNIDKTYYQSTQQLLRARSKLYQQNDYHYERSDTTSENNLYNGNSASSCSCRPVTYKPNNANFKKQGAVSSSDRLLRLKYKALTGGGNGCPNCRKYRYGQTQNVYLNQTGCNRNHTNGNKTICN